MATLQTRLARLFVRTFLHSRAAEFLPVSQVRRALDTFSMPLPRGVQVEKVHRDGVSGEWLRPASAGGDATFLYLHGGAYCVGSCRSHRSLAGHLARNAGMRAFLQEYRLAPEHPFPAAIDDAVAAYQMLRRETPGPVFVAGDSAGGGLALALTHMLRARGEPLPEGLVLFSPWADLTLAGGTMQTLATRDAMLSPRYLQIAADRYLGSTDPKTPAASPLFGDFAGFPPVLIQVGSDEVLLDDARRVAEKARQAGVALTYQEAAGMWHVWQAFGDKLPESAQALRDAGDFLRALLPAAS